MLLPVHRSLRSTLPGENLSAQAGNCLNEEP